MISWSKFDSKYPCPLKISLSLNNIRKHTGMPVYPIVSQCILVYLSKFQCSSVYFGISQQIPVYLSISRISQYIQCISLHDSAMYPSVLQYTPVQCIPVYHTVASGSQCIPVYASICQRIPVYPRIRQCIPSSSPNSIIPLFFRVIEKLAKRPHSDYSLSQTITGICNICYHFILGPCIFFLFL